jgi:capsular polysaccharide biosynthesis protein
MDTQKNEEMVIDLRELFYYFWKKKWIWIVSAVVVAVVAGIWSYYITVPMYSSTAKLYIFTKSSATLSVSDIQLSSNLTGDYMELIESRPVVETVIENLNLTDTYEGLLSSISITNPTDTTILNITATNSDPHLAQLIADEFAEVSRKQIAKIMSIDEPNVVEDAHLSDAPVNLHLKRNILMGALLGIVISGAILLLLYMLDDTIKTADDVEKYLGISVLTSVPLNKEAQKNKHHKKRKSVHY